MKKILYKLAITFILLSFIGCSGAGIFYTLEKEVELIDNTLPNDVNIKGMVNYDSTYYVLSGSTIYKNTDLDSGTWTSMGDVTLGETTYTDVLSIALFDGNLIASLSNTSIETDTGTEILTFAIARYDGSTWSKESTTLKQTEIYQVDDNLIFQEKDDTSYKLYHTTDSTNLTPVDLDISTTLYQPIEDVVMAGAAVFISSGSSLYKSSSLTGSFAELTVSDLDETTTITSLAYGDLSSGTYTVFGTEDGYLYYSNDGGSNWTKTDSQLEDDDDIVITFLSLEFLEIDSTKLLLTGTESNGYYEYKDFTAPSSDTERILTDDVENYTTGDISTASILDFYVTPDHFFALTVGEGLWNLTDDSWIIE